MLILALLFSNYGETVYATSVRVETIYDILKSSAEEELLSIPSGNGSTESGQYGLFSELENIVAYSMFFDFLYKNQTTLSLNKKQLTVYAKGLNTRMVNFNSRYSIESDVYTALELAKGKKKYNYDRVTTYNSETLYNDVTGYITTYLNDMSSQTEDALSAYKSILGAIYSLIENLLDDAETISTWGNEGSLVSGNAGSFQTYLNSLLANSSYESILTIGASSSSLQSNEDIAVDLQSPFIESLASVYYDTEGTLQIEENPSLSLSYLAIFAASAVYTPFVSYAGCTEFTEALKSLAKSNVQDDLLMLYNSTKVYKKPLYRRELDKTGTPTGVADLITLSEFVEDIENGNTGALCTVLGAFEENSGVWLYRQQLNQSSASNQEITVPYAGETSNYELDKISLTINVSPNDQETNNDSGIQSGEDNLDFFDYTDNSEATSETASETASEVSSLDLLKNNLLNNFRADAYVSDGFSESNPEYGTTGGSPVYAYESITDENAMSAPVLLYGTKYFRSTDNLTTAVLGNILKSYYGLNWIINASSRYLYVNIYGDIVLDNDLVILPGAANPLFYKENTYNPFTVAFMNSYPSVLKNSENFRLASRSDVGKYLIFGVKNETDTLSCVGAKITSTTTINPQGPISIPNLTQSFTSNAGADKVTVFRARQLLFDSESASPWKSDSDYSSYNPLLINSTITINGAGVFPYVVEEDDLKNIATAIVENMFTYFAVDGDTYSRNNMQMLNDGYMLDALIINGLYGTTNATGYQNDTLLDYNVYAGNESNRKLDTLLELSRNIFNNFTGVSGVIGVKSVYDNKIVGTILTFVRENILLFFFAIILVLLFYFSKVRLDILQCVILSAVGIVFGYVYINVLPSLLPTAFNLFTNNVVQTTSYEILGLDAEHYSFDENPQNYLNSEGSRNLNSTSITLYKVTGAARKNFASSMGIKDDDLVGGKLYVLNKQAGVYAKNDEICVSTNVLFDTLKITGELDSSFAYILDSKKTVSSNVDYYIPYYLIVDSLIGKVNQVSQIYCIPRKTSVYANGKVKNNYMLYSYVNSRPFVSPGDYSFAEPSENENWTQDEINAYRMESQRVAEELDAAFGDNADWLGISEWLIDLPESAKKTLWANTMQELGYYDEHWIPNADKMNDLISYVNYHTRKFVLDMSDEIGVLSDDVMIKIVSMRALIALTQRASDFGNWMYPFTVNYEEMSVENVLQSILISDYNKYVDFDMDVVQYVLDEHGWLNLIVFDLLVVVLFLVVSVIGYAVPIFYLILGILICFRLCLGQGIKEPIKGYLKLSLIIMLCSTALTFTVLGVKAMDGSVIGLYFMLAMLLLITTVLWSLLSSVLFNFTELGNTAINVNISNRIHGFSDRSKKLLSKNKIMKTDRLLYRKSGAVKHRNHYNRDDRYSLYNGVDDYYDYYDGYGNYGNRNYISGNNRSGDMTDNKSSASYNSRAVEEVSEFETNYDGEVTEFEYDNTTETDDFRDLN